MLRKSGLRSCFAHGPSVALGVRLLRQQIRTFHMRPLQPLYRTTNMA